MPIIANAVKRDDMLLTSIRNPDELDPSVWLINPDFSAVEDIPKYYWKIANEQLVEMSDAEKTVVDTTQRAESLMIKIEAIDSKTQAIIEDGFTYSSMVFSLSQPAQATWTLLKLAQLSGTLTFPIEVATIDDQIYEIQDVTEFTAFTTALDTTVVIALATGRAIKAQVKALTHSDEIDAFVDPRN